MGTEEPASDREATPVVPVVGYRSAGANAREGARPASLTALGVMSLVVGVLGIGLHLATVRRIARVFQQTAAPLAVTALPSLPHSPDGVSGPPAYVPRYTGEWNVPGGMGRAERELVVEHLTTRHGLGVDRRLMLRRLLGDAGGEIFARRQPGPLRDDADVATWIYDTGRTPVGPDGAGVLGTDYFRTPAGTVLIDDNVARFFHADRSPPVCVELNQVARGPAGAEPRLCAVQIEQALDDLRRQHGALFTPTQATALARRLAALPQHERAFAAFSAGPPTFAPPLKTRFLDGGTLEVDAGYMTWVLRDGRVIVNPSGLDPATGRPIPLISVAAARPSAVTRPLAYAASAHLIAGVALASFLAVCGTMTLGDAPAAGRNHARWAWVKLASVVAVTIPMFAAAVAGARERYGQDARGQIAIAIVAAAVVLLAEAAYPLIVLAALRSPRVQAFYSACGASVAPVSAERCARWWSRAASISDGRRGRITATFAGVVIAAALVTHAHLTPRTTSADEWYGWTATRATVILVATAALLACAVRITRRGGGVAGALVVLCMTVAAAAPATRRTPPAPHPRIFQSPNVFGSSVEEAVVRDSRSAQTYLRQTAAEAAGAPALAPLRARPLPDDLRERLADALDELGWIGCAETLQSLLVDPDAAVRRAAALALHDNPRIARAGPAWRERVNAALAGEPPEETQRRLLATDRERARGVDWTRTATGPSADAVAMAARDATPGPPPRWLAPLAAAVAFATSFAVLLVAAVRVTCRPRPEASA